MTIESRMLEAGKAKEGMTEGRVIQGRQGVDVNDGAVKR